MGKMAEFDETFYIRLKKKGKEKSSIIGVGDVRQEISAKAYMQYNQENLNTMDSETW